MQLATSANDPASQPRNMGVSAGADSCREGIASFLLIAAGMLLLLGGALVADFYIVEDHHLLGLPPWTLQSWIERVYSDAVDFQRFRPLYWAYIAFGATAYGRNPHVWHFFALLWGTLTLFFFFRTARRLGAGLVASSIFIATLAVSDGQSWIWMNLVPQETAGMLLLSLALWAFSQAAESLWRVRWDTLGLLALMLAALCKESFMLVIPAVMMLRVWTEVRRGGTWGQAVASAKIPVSIAALFLTLGLMTIVLILASKPDGYSANASGISLASFNPLHWLRIISTFGLNWPLGLALLALFVDGVRSPSRRGPIAIAMILLFVWLAPQLVLYTKGMSERYMFPGIVAVSGLVSLGYSALPRILFSVLRLVFIVVLAPALVTGALAANKTANWLAAETSSVARMVGFLAQNAPPSKAVVVVGDPGTGYGFESLYALPIHLRLAGSTSGFYTWPLPSKGDRNAMQQVAQSAETMSMDPSAIAPRRVGAVVVMDAFTQGLQDEPLQEWLQKSKWQELFFNENYRYMTARGRVETGEVIHMVRVPVESGLVSRNQLISIDPSLSETVGVLPELKGPPWGLEKDYAGPGRIVWLGQGDNEGLGGALTATAPQRVRLTVQVVEGPSREGAVRTVELVVGTGSAQRAYRQTFAGGEWKFDVDLQVGSNPFRLRILDTPTVKTLPNGDTRTLMALVRKITVLPSP